MKHLKFLFIFLFGLFVISCTNKEESQDNDFFDSHIEKRHRSNELLLDPCGDLILKVAVCQCDSGSDEIDITQTHVIDAIAEFNSLDLKLNLIVVECDEDIERDIVVHCGWLTHNSCIIGETSTMGGIPFIGTVIDPVAYFLQCCPEQSLTDEEGDCYMKGLIMHEMMHAIGFDHTDDTSTPLIPGTLEEDPASMANEGSCDFTACEFSAGDIQALEILYGPCACDNTPPDDWLSIEGPTSLCEGEEGTFCVTGPGSSDWTITMTSDGNSTVLGPDNCLDISYTDPRVHTVSIVACHDDFPDCCITAWVEVNVLPEDGECYCVCEAQDQYGPVGGFKDNKNLTDNKSNIEEWKFPVDCCDPRPCSEIIPEWWEEYLVDAKECFKKEDECTPPAVSLQGGDDDICVGHTKEFCISGSYNGSTTWSATGGNLSYSSSNCRNFTPTSSGEYEISVKVCHREDGEGQEECCVTLALNGNSINCEEECYCDCKDGQGGFPVELVYDCKDDNIGDCYDIFYEDDIVDCVKRRR